MDFRIIANLLDQIDSLKAENSALADESGDCCPKGSLGSLTVDYTAKGTESMLSGDLPVYTVGDPSSGRGVIVAYDIYGFNGGRIRNI